MVEENLKDFSINWIVTGLLFFCLLSFAISFMYNNNPLGLGEDADDIFGTSVNNISSNLLAVPEDSDILLNISANTDPESSYLGSRDSVATSYSMTGSGKGFWESSKIFFSWVLSGSIGQMLLAVFSGMIGFTLVYYITKWVRIGT